MKIMLKTPARRIIPAALVFCTVAVGVYAAVPGRDARDASLVPVVVAAGRLDEGTAAMVVRRNVSVRMVPADARASGAITSVDRIPDGVLAYPLVGAQQLLTTSFAEDHVSSLGADYVAVSVMLDTQRWAGPVLQSGRRVDVWDTDEAGPKLVASDAVVLDPPSPAGLKADADTIISLGVRADSVAGVLLAAANKRVWLVSR